MGGILSNHFMEFWFPSQVLAIQHGNPNGPTDHWLTEDKGEKHLSTGPSILSERERKENHAHTLDNFRARELDDEWYQQRSPNWDNVEVPFQALLVGLVLDCILVEILRHLFKQSLQING